MSQLNDITLVILAGGKAKRMGGQNKAFLEFEGKTFIERIHRNLYPLFQNTLIISNDKKDFNLPLSTVYPDIIENIGPLGGIHSALVHSVNPLIFVVSCDMPFADLAIAKKLIDKFHIEQPEICVPTINSFVEPLFAIYSKHLFSRIEQFVSSLNGKPVKSLLDKSCTSFLSLPDNAETKMCFTNINTTEDLNAIHSI